MILEKIKKDKWSFIGMIASFFLGIILIKLGFTMFYHFVVFEGSFTIQQGINIVFILISWEIVKFGFRLIQPDFEMEEREWDFLNFCDKYKIKIK